MPRSSPPTSTATSKTPAKLNPVRLDAARTRWRWINPLPTRSSECRFITPSPTRESLGRGLRRYQKDRQRPYFHRAEPEQRGDNHGSPKGASSSSGIAWLPALRTLQRGTG